MCGVIAVCSNINNVTDYLITALDKLEYRGYDSAGIAVQEKQQIKLRRAVGKLINLKQEIDKSPVSGNIGIGHTRWATHGEPEIDNTHPFVIADIAMVHNGIIENYQKIKQKLLNKGYKFKGSTDSEILLTLIVDYVQTNIELKEAIRCAVGETEGNFAIVIMYQDMLIGYKKGTPLAIGIGRDEMFFCSDAIVLSLFTNKIIYLEDDDIALIKSDIYEIYECHNMKAIARDTKRIEHHENSSKENFASYMLKEIYQQPEILTRILKQYVVGDRINFDINLTAIKRINIIACGTSYHAAMTAKYIFEKYAKIVVETDLASEYRYRNPIISKDELYIVISQSGETADTFAALKYIKQNSGYVAAIVNVIPSSIANNADYIIPLHAGNEISVASTKAFTAQLLVLTLLALHLLPKQRQQSLLSELYKLPDLVKTLIQDHEKMAKNLASQLIDAEKILYIGRNIAFPLALEGALKMKELSYISAEGFAAGELKHGPIALVDHNTPIVAIAPSNILFDKTISNVQEVIARNGKVILVSDQTSNEAWYNIKMPKCSDIITPLLYTIPLQLLAYYLTCSKNYNADQPRNLAKSVTVE